MFSLTKLRRRCILALIFLVFSVPLFAQSVITLSEDGKQAWYTPNGMSTGILADHVIRLSGNSPNIPIPIPDNPDRWGLTAVSETAALNVRGDPNRNETAGKLMAVYVTLGKQLQSGAVQSSQIKALLELSFQFATGSAEDAWRPWQTVTQKKFNSFQFTDTQKAGQGTIDIGVGVGRTSNAPQHAIDDFFEWFLKLLPFLIKLIGLFGGAELDAMLEASAGGV